MSETEEESNQRLYTSPGSLFVYASWMALNTLPGGRPSFDPDCLYAQLLLRAYAVDDIQVEYLGESDMSPDGKEEH